jgi:hypothetical protein
MPTPCISQTAAPRYQHRNTQDEIHTPILSTNSLTTVSPASCVWQSTNLDELRCDALEAVGVGRGGPSAQQVVLAGAGAGQLGLRERDVAAVAAAGISRGHHRSGRDLATDRHTPSDKGKRRPFVAVLCPTLLP